MFRKLLATDGLLMRLWSRVETGDLARGDEEEEEGEEMLYLWRGMLSLLRSYIVCPPAPRGVTGVPLRLRCTLGVRGDIRPDTPEGLREARGLGEAGGRIVSAGDTLWYEEMLSEIRELSEGGLDSNLKDILSESSRGRK